MPELRKDPVIDRWVIIATERARRPGNIINRNGNCDEDEQEECLYCQSEETGNNVLDDVKVIPVNDSLLVNKEDLHPKSNGLYQVIEGAGFHEIIVETDFHIANLADLPKDKITKIIGIYAQRVQYLKEMKRFTYIVIYKNYGARAGSRQMSHARSHVVGLPIIPLRTKEMMVCANNHWVKNKKCIFCDLIEQELKDEKRVVMETDNFIAIIPYAAKYLFEIHVYPKDHNCHFDQGVKGKEEELAGFMKILLEKIKIGLDDCAYNYVIHTAPINEGCQDNCFFVNTDESYHWHIEIMPRLTQMAGFEKGTGFYICSVPPEDMAGYIRGVKI